MCCATCLLLCCFTGSHMSASNCSDASVLTDPANPVKHSHAISATNAVAMQYVRICLAGLLPDDGKLMWLANGLILVRSTTHTPTKLLLQEHATSLPSCWFTLMSCTCSHIAEGSHMTDCCFAASHSITLSQTTEEQHADCMAKALLLLRQPCMSLSTSRYVLP